MEFRLELQSAPRQIDYVVISLSLFNIHTHTHTQICDLEHRFMHSSVTLLKWLLVTNSFSGTQINRLHSASSLTYDGFLLVMLALYCSSKDGSVSGSVSSQPSDWMDTETEVGTEIHVGQRRIIPVKYLIV